MGGVLESFLDSLPRNRERIQNVHRVSENCRFNKARYGLSRCVSEKSRSLAAFGLVKFNHPKRKFNFSFDGPILLCCVSKRTAM
jgi:hypothetical protein